MKQCFRAGLLAAFFSAALAGQTPTPTQTPKPVQNDDDVVKISTTLIQVDVTVTDNAGKIVRDLRSDEFEIYENGQKQNLTNFSFISQPGAPAKPEIKKPNKNDPVIPLPPLKLRPEQVKRTIALVVDDLGLSFESVYFVRRALKKFVDEQMQPNDLVAIVRTGSGAGALQQFTSDRSQLYAAIENLRWNGLGRSGISAFAPIEASAMETSGATQEEIDADAKRMKDFNAFREDIFSVGTLGAINFIVKGMKELPGRKSIRLFSDGFVICTPDSPDRCTRIKDSVRQLTDLCNRASVTIYSFDARGLQYTGLTAADDTGSLGSTAVQERLGARNAEVLDKQDGLAYLSTETGGRSFFNNNDFNKGMDKALEDQEGFYLLGYQPDSDTFDARTRRFNKLSIKVNRPGVNVRYRSGFFGITDNKTKVSNMTPIQQFQTALTSPFAINGINLRLNALFGYDLRTGPYVRSFLHVSAKDLKFTEEADGSHKAAFDVLAVSFGANGVPVDQISKNYALTLRGETYKRVLAEGFIYNFLFPIMKPGPYQMRVALRDSSSAKIGSANQFIQVPDIKKNRLNLSGIVVENWTFEQWSRNQTPAATPETEKPLNTDPMADTSLRQFDRGTVLKYSVEIYNAKLNGSKEPELQTQIRVFRDGKNVLDGIRKPLILPKAAELQRIVFTGALSLGSEMPPGDYVLQIVVIDALAKEKYKISTEWIQFEVR